MHGIQAWVALPDGKEEVDPSFAHHGESDLPVLEEGGMKIRIIAGKAFGREASVTTHSPMFYAHADLGAGASIETPDDYPERAIYVASGCVEVGGETFHPGQMLIFPDHGPAVARAAENSIVMLLGGDPVGPRFIEWNFVSSSRERIEQAKADWRGGRMKLPDRDRDEFIPLPEPPPAPNPMS